MDLCPGLARWRPRPVNCVLTLLAETAVRTLASAGTAKYHPMPLDPKRVQAVFLSAVECDEPGARAAVLDRECSGDAELRQRVKALLQPSRTAENPPRSTDRDHHGHRE